MYDEPNEQPPPLRRPSNASLSRTPSWVLLGFLLGLGFMWLLPERKGAQALDLDAPAVTAGVGAGKVTPAADGSAQAGAGAAGATGGGAAAVQGKDGGAATSELVAPVQPPQPRPRVISTVEAVFEIYGKHAVWDRDVTQVALWNPEHGSFSDCYEVRREDGVFWFRSIPSLSRPMLALPDHPEVPLVFTETEAMRKEREEARAQLVPARAEPPDLSERKPRVEMPRP